MSTSHRPVQILVVCSANECRSVYAVDELRSVGFDDRFNLLSAGTQANPGAPRCSEAEHHAGHAQLHTSRVLEKEVIAQADLILVMDREHRARVAEIEPKARFRCFTLREIARLAELLNSAIKREDFAASAEFVALLPANWKQLSTTRRMQWWIDELNEARGFSDPLADDIADAHGVDAVDHKVVFALISESISQFAAHTLGAINLNFERQLVAGGR
ncbi:MAG: hypothetical protein RIS75_946 [Actinomycetota bacterium]